MKDTTTSSNDLIITSYDNSPSSVRLLMTYIEATNLEKFKEKLSERPLPQKTKNNLLKKALSCYTQVPKVKEIIECLLANGADPNINMCLNMKEKDQPVIYPLMYIVETNDFDLLKIFLRYGALPNLKDSNNRNCLFYLFKSHCDNKVPMGKAVLHSSININDTDIYGFTVLMEAVNRNMRDLVEVFLEYKADVNYQNTKDENTAIHYAVKNKNIEMIQMLLSHKPNLNICNKNKDTPLDIATKMTSQTEIYAILAEHYSNDITKYNDDYNHWNNNDNRNYSNQNNYGNTYNNSSIQKGNKKYDFNDCIFKHQINHVHSRIEIPFTFHDKMNTSNNYQNDNNYIENNYNKNYLPSSNNSINNNSSNNLNNSSISSTLSNGSNQTNTINNSNSNNNQLHSYLSISKTPTLHLDISDETSQEMLIYDGLKSDNIQNAYKIKKNETESESTCIDNDKLKAELKSLKDNFQLKEQRIKLLNDEIKQKELENIGEFNDFQSKMEEQNNKYNSLQSILEKLRDKAHHERIGNIPDYYNRKFNTLEYDEMCNLSKDILDFYQLTKFITKQKEPYISKILISINEIITSCHIDYRANLCGSYATGLNLDWSDLNVVLYPTIPQHSKDLSTLQTLFIKFKECSWVQSIQLNNNLLLFTNESNGQITVNISIHDHLKYNPSMHVEYTKYLLKLYPTLEPMVIVLKQFFQVSNLLKYPGVLNSYGLTLMIVFFFQVQLTTINSIDIKDSNNLGRLFKEFCKYYAKSFDNTKNLILIQDSNFDQNAFNYLTNNIRELIIVDPTNHLHNVAEETYHYINVKVALILGYAVTNQNCECSCHYLSEANDQGHNSTIEHCLLKRIFQSLKRLTINMN